MGDDNVHIRPAQVDPDNRGQTDPHRRRASAEERKGRGSSSWTVGLTPSRRRLTPRRRDDQAVNVPMSVVADHRYVVIIMSSFVCKRSVGQQSGSAGQRLQQRDDPVRGDEVHRHQIYCNAARFGPYPTGPAWAPSGRSVVWSFP
jgi:hypothetical protein